MWMSGPTGRKGARGVDSSLNAMTSQALESLFESLKNWGRWGSDDQLGALNHLTAECRQGAAALVRDGLTISLASDMPVRPSAEAPYPTEHHMLTAGDARHNTGQPGYEASRDYIGTHVHGLGITHIDALCHMFVAGQMYNGVSADQVRSDGAQVNTIMTLREGIAGRGVLLDIPRTRGVDFLDRDDLITQADLDQAERAAGTAVRTGDVLLVSTGRDVRRQAAGGTLNPADGMAGLHPESLPWLHEREVAVLGSDGISDAMPGLRVPMWPYPIHQIGITAIGLHLIDNMSLASLAAHCATLGRWEFLFVVAPLRVPGGTGCPVNPLALL
jgi:kynurenine formamidase